METVAWPPLILETKRHAHCSDNQLTYVEAFMAICIGMQIGPIYEINSHRRTKCSIKIPYGKHLSYDCFGDQLT